MTALPTKIAQPSQPIDPKLYDIRSIITPKPPDLIEPGRTYIREGELYVFNPKEKNLKTRYFYLFSDVLLLTKKETSKRYWLKVWISLRTNLRIEPSPNPSEPIDAFQFRIYAPKRTFIIFARNELEKESWFKSIQSCIDRCRQENPVPPDTESVLNSVSSPTVVSPRAASPTAAPLPTTTTEVRATMSSSEVKRPPEPADSPLTSPEVSPVGSPADTSPPDSPHHDRAPLIPSTRATFSVNPSTAIGGAEGKVLSPRGTKSILSPRDRTQTSLPTSASTMATPLLSDSQDAPSSSPPPRPSISGPPPSLTSSSSSQTSTTTLVSPRGGAKVMSPREKNEKTAFSPRGDNNEKAFSPRGPTNENNNSNGAVPILDPPPASRNTRATVSVHPSEPLGNRGPINPPNNQNNSNNNVILSPREGAVISPRLANPNNNPNSSTPGDYNEMFKSNPRGRATTQFPSFANPFGNQSETNQNSTDPRMFQQFDQLEQLQKQQLHQMQQLQQAQQIINQSPSGVEQQQQLKSLEDMLKQLQIEQLQIQQQIQQRLLQPLPQPTPANPSSTSTLASTNTSSEMISPVIGGGGVIGGVGPGGRSQTVSVVSPLPPLTSPFSSLSASSDSESNDEEKYDFSRPAIPKRKKTVCFNPFEEKPTTPQS